MQNVKILHTADLHIGAEESFLGPKAALRRTEALLTFEKIIDTALSCQVQVLLIAGDLLHSNKVEHSFFQRIIDKIKEAKGLKVVFAAGNHDPLNGDSAFTKYALPENLFVLGKKDSCLEFGDLGVRVYGRSFSEVYEKGTPRFSLTPAEDDYINLMCIHGEHTSGLDSDYNSITDEFISTSGMDYIALGHVHKRTPLQCCGKTYFAYCGCPEGQGFDELSEKGVYIGKVFKGGCDLEFLPLCKRMHIAEEIDISSLYSPVKIADKIFEVLKAKYGETYIENLYKIILLGSIEEDVEINLAEIKGRLEERLYFVTLKDKTEPKADFELLKAENSLKGIFVKKMLEKIEKASFEEKDALKNALILGLRAFRSEVSFNEDN